jgi:hypothetical protein
MPEVITIRDKPETLFSARDFEYQVEKYMGYEAAEYFRKYAERADEEVRAALDHENTDYAAVESDLERADSLFNDIQDVVDRMKTILDEPRLNRQNLIRAVRDIQEIIDKEI